MAPRRKGLFPPQQDHNTTFVSASEAQETLSKYLTGSKTRAHLHPNSTLSSTGIDFSHNTGPSGGIVLHQLKRIEAGLRGEDLEPETREELIAKFGEEEMMIEPFEYIDDSNKKRRNRELRGMNPEDIEQWSSDVTISREIESFANTPLHTPMYENIDAEGWQGLQDLQEWQESQEIWEGDIGERNGANGTIIDEIPELVVEGSGRTAQEKEERKRRKKEKKEMERRQKAAEMERQKG